MSTRLASFMLGLSKDVDKYFDTHFNHVKHNGYFDGKEIKKARKGKRKKKRA